MESERQSVAGPKPGQPVSQSSSSSVTIAASFSTLLMFTRRSSEGRS